MARRGRRAPHRRATNTLSSRSQDSFSSITSASSSGTSRTLKTSKLPSSSRQRDTSPISSSRTSYEGLTQTASSSSQLESTETEESTSTPDRHTSLGINPLISFPTTSLQTFVQPPIQATSAVILSPSNTPHKTNSLHIPVSSIIIPQSAEAVVPSATNFTQTLIIIFAILAALLSSFVIMCLRPKIRSLIASNHIKFSESNSTLRTPGQGAVQPKVSSPMSISDPFPPTGDEHFGPYYDDCIDDRIHDQATAKGRQQEMATRTWERGRGLLLPSAIQQQSIALRHRRDV